MYSTYLIRSKQCYHGNAIVAADNKDEANFFIQKERHEEIFGDSFGMLEVDEYDKIEGLFADHKGIITSAIYYYG